MGDEGEKRKKVFKILYFLKTFRHLPVLPVVLGAVVLELLTEPVEAHSGPSLCYGKAPPPPPSQPSFY